MSDLQDTLRKWTRVSSILVKQIFQVPNPRMEKALACISKPSMRPSDRGPERRLWIMAMNLKVKME